MKYAKEVSALLMVSMLAACGPSAELKEKQYQDALLKMPDSIPRGDSLVKLHYSMRANFETKNALQTTLQIEHLCAAQGGYIERSTVEKNTISTHTVAISKDSSSVLTQFNHQTTLLLQVPIARAGYFVDSLARYAVKLNLREIRTENLASNFVQAQSLKNEYTGNYSNFQKDYASAKPTKVSPQEQYETKQNYLHDKATSAAAVNELQFQTAYAAIELNFTDDARIEQKNIQNMVLPSVYGSDLGSQIIAAFMNGCELLKNLGLLLLRLWPMVAVTALIVLAYRRKNKHIEHLKSIFQSSVHK